MERLRSMQAASRVRCWAPTGPDSYRALGRLVSSSPTSRESAQPTRPDSAQVDALYRWRRQVRVRARGSIPPSPPTNYRARHQQTHQNTGKQCRMKHVIACLLRNHTNYLKKQSQIHLVPVSCCHGERIKMTLFILLKE